ncbi:FomB family phosphonate monophosphate kinase [Streptomyces sp. CB01881]|uniref:FomB family phosphonate monophosphate kinase n=1 Tax=Streptomyces sp. CB01881 TaxID=2078691 RepID=UPI000CDBF83D|nr:FomB family phosphonate monophosphate kinase [Streptomyces sp. CB01881]AUY53122.1 FomB family phosphonate monophosphate kinase [Streptomyces sp. CB01881]TYC69274.1 FomB family phosphonate monophosphate kinase [Streptomyces sp. CB01881]
MTAPFTGPPAAGPPPGPAIRSTSVVDLNLIRIRLCSNLESPPARSYFTRFAADDAAADFEIRCYDLDRDKVDVEAVRHLVDSTVRAKRFTKGYYRGPYFGDPVYLVTRGRTFHVYGRSLEKLVWPYFIKHILSVHAAENGLLDLKAAGFTLNGDGTLLFGQTGGGKSVFLAQACLGGAQFLSNTHMLVRGVTAHGVPSAMRVRRDACFGELIDRHRLPRHIEEGEYISSPEILFGKPATNSAPVRNIVIVNSRQDTPAGFHQVDPGTALPFLDQFGLGVTTYGLKDDLIAHFGYDVQRYAKHYNTMQKTLAGLCENARCYVSNVDMMDPSARAAVLSDLQ